MHMVARGDNTCPHCGKEVDPLRSPAVSIVGARIVHFCSVECREDHLRGPSSVSPPSVDIPSASGGPEQDSKANDRGSLESASMVNLESPSHDSLATTGSAAPGWWRSASFIGAVGALMAGIVAATVDWREGLLGVVLAATLALWDLLRGIRGAIRDGAVRVLDEVAQPVAALMLLVASLLSGGSRATVLAAIVVLAAVDFGRLATAMTRRRSGVAAARFGAAGLPLGESFKDNTRLRGVNQKIATVLSWSRFAVAAAAAVGLSWLAGAPESVALIVGASTLLALGPRAFRLATIDAYYAAALRLVRLGAMPRDAEAIERLGAARVVVFEGAGTSFPDVAVVSSLWVVSETAETTVLEALADLEIGLDSRMAQAIAAYVKAKGYTPFEDTQREEFPDKGVVGETRYGEVVCGSRAFLLSCGIGTGALEDHAVALEESGRRAVLVAMAGCPVAVVGVEDRPEPSCVAAAQQLAEMGRHCVMLTSAEVAAAQSLAHRMGMGDACFETSVTELRKVVESYEAAGDVSVVVGTSMTLEELGPQSVAIRVGGQGLTRVAIDGRRAGLAAVPGMLALAAEARLSAVTNTALSVISLLLGVGLAVTWSAPLVAAAIAVLQSTTGVAVTINRPFPGWTKAARKAEALARRWLRIVLSRWR